MKICLWCNEKYTKLAKSHIIPKAFFNYDGANDRLLVGKNEHKKRRPIGSYDSNILCLDCEKAYCHIDSKAHDILINIFDESLILFQDSKDILAFQISKSYEKTIKQFLLYVLWRASVSKLPEFKNVKLGPYENKIKHALIENKDFLLDEFSFLAVKVANPFGHFYPYRSDTKKVPYYRLDFADYSFEIKVSNKRTPSPLRILAEHEHIIFIKMENRPEKVIQAMREIVQHNHEFNNAQ